MKKSGTLVSWIAIFVAGFIAGMVFSAWKLDTGGRPAASPATSQESDPRQQLENRIAGLERMLAVQPDNLEALIQLGNDYFDAGRHREAIATYQKALAIDAKNPNVIVDMGISLRRTGKPGEAIEAFKRALEIDPGHPMALFNMGIVYKDDLNNPKEALKAWETFLEKAGNAPHAVMVRPWVKQLKEKLGAN